jgi:thymidylate synthase
MKNYHDLMQRILEEGVDRPDRTGTGTRALFGQQMRFDLSKSFPAITTKKLAWKACLSELLWFIEGSGDEGRLREILHGDRDSEKGTIWTDNANASYWQPKAKYPGDLGRVYGVQWRHWKTGRNVPTTDKDGHVWHLEEEVDQLTELIDGIRRDPYGRRHVITAWNPGELGDMALPPCHMFAQFFVADGKLSCQMYQRSCDMFLGVPFNIASYSLFTHMIAQVCGLNVGEFVWVGGDCHIYSNHFEQVKEQLGREAFPEPTLSINPSVTNILEFKMSDFELLGYQSHGTIKAQMAV